MASGTVKRIGPLALTTTLTTNVYNNSSALIYDVIKQIHITNKTALAATFTLYIGATGANAAGTELFIQQNVPAFGSFDHYCSRRLNSTDFLVGGAGTATALTITIDSEQFAA